MPIVAAAVVPHSPLLLPTIAKHHAERSARLVGVLRDMGQELYARQPDTAVVITPHGLTLPDTATIDVGDTLSGSLTAYGDLSTTLNLPGAVGLSHRLKETAEDAGVPLLLQTQQGLDYGVTVPWLTLWPEPMPWSVLPLAIPGEPTPMTLRLGEVLHDFFQSRPERVVLLASGDTNRRPTKMSDADRRPTADERTLSEAITTLSPALALSVRSSDVCLRSPLGVVLATVNGSPMTGVIRAFDVPLTVGQIAAMITPV